ncbi:tyrosine-type recombinase/integrase [Bacillus velezensis]|uniref:tyrosine-type recombinase/integrase n=1 Tax=Bacillus TaxID=1386 RepID=UPI0014282E15|nr:site-specific integrase [Bacillus velezensis]MEC1701571.1 site-specific integrase [Bacillus velezensis]QIR31790.1 Putative prophage phiRv2 integrase [Bacillus velezensis]
MSVKKLENGQYQVDVSFGFDPITGERIRTRPITSTRKEALELEAKLRREFQEERARKSRSVSFPTLISIYLANCEIDSKPNYYQNQKYIINKHISDYFLKSDIQKITHREITNFRKHLMETGLSNKSVNNIMTSLSKIFDTAVHEEILKRNPCDNVKRLPLTRKKMKFWRPEEFKKFISLIPQDQLLFKTFYTVAFLTGLRCGEMLALQWKDIDKILLEIDVHKSCTWLDGQFVVTTPKTKNSIRRVSINKKLLKLLERWREAQEELFNELGIRHSHDTYIFQYKDTPSRKDIFSRKIKYFCKDSDLTPIRLHDFRHSHVALLIHQGEDYITIKERLGHGSVKTTIDVYGHLYPNKQKEMADKLDDLL